jgi:tetratricopeptide (TPR) repeat protein
MKSGKQGPGAPSRAKKAPHRFGSKDLILFVIGYLGERKDIMQSPNRKIIAQSLDMTEKTMNNRLSELRNQGFLESKKQSRVAGHVLTIPGRRIYGSLYDIVMSTNLTPEQHRCEGRMEKVLPAFRDPADIVKVVFHVMTERKLDIVSVYKFEQAKNPGSKEMILLKELLDVEGTLDMPFEKMIDLYTLIGKGPQEIFEMDSESILDSIIYADFLRRQMMVHEAKGIYSDILRNRAGPRSGYRIFCLVGLIMCTKVTDGHKAALKMVDDFLMTLNAPAFKVMMTKTKADLLIYSDLAEARRLYRSCINSLKNLKLYALECGTYNNLGVAYFREGNFKEAERCWEKVLSISRDRDYYWIEAVTKLNYADAKARSGDIGKADRLLEEAFGFFTSVNDIEGISGYHFNKAIVSVHKGDRDRSLEHFRKCDEFFAVYKEHREMQREELRKLFIERGWDAPVF